MLFQEEVKVEYVLEGSTSATNGHPGQEATLESKTKHSTVGKSGPQHHVFHSTGPPPWATFLTIADVGSALVPGFLMDYISRSYLHEVFFDLITSLHQSLSLLICYRDYPTFRQADETVRGVQTSYSCRA